MATKKNGPENAEFIGRVVNDPKNPPETRLLTGWFGDSSEEKSRRLYTDAQLSGYVDIPNDAILHTEPVRDSQPAGAHMVWVKAAVTLKQGGAAYARAARFLQGQVAQDFASGAALSPENVGLRCVTKAPCAEPTGFSGICTKQPDWPCITAPPHCAEITGFTGKCTHQPWPNPTQYIGCTHFHCPTHDLTCIPQICNIVATGLPGCGGVNPPPEGDQQKAVKGQIAPTEPPGCGYTKFWGLCETRLLGCGWTRPPHCPQPTIPNGDCTFFGNCPQPTYPNGDCTFFGNCLQQQPNQFAGAARANPALQPSAICATAIGCDITLICLPSIHIPCPTRFEPQCFPWKTLICPITIECPFGQQAGGAPVQQRAAVVNNTFPPCSAVDSCPTQRGCPHTEPPTQLCTPDPQFCPPTFCGPQCQTPQPGCTQVNCTRVPEACPSLGILCTQVDPTCPTRIGCPSVQQPCTTVQAACSDQVNTFFPCTRVACPTNFRCNLPG